MSMLMTWTLGELIAKARKDAGFDQRELAERINVARNSLSNYETGRSTPPFDVAVRIAAACDIEITVFADAVNAETAPAEAGAVSDLRAPRDSNPQPSDWEAIDAEYEALCVIEAVAL